MAAVVGLASDATVYGPNNTRLPSFVGAWASAWPGLHVRHQPTFVNHPGLRGYGVAVGYYLALTESLRYLRARNETCDYHLVFEDDARPFNGTTWPGAEGHPTGVGAPSNGLDARLDEVDAAGGTALLLGGHRFQNVSRAQAAAAAARPLGGVVPAGMADGAYAYVIKCSTLGHVVRHIHAHLHQTNSTAYFESNLWAAFTLLRDEQGIGTGVYVSAPLMVDHAHGFSATWNKTVDRPFEGNATFWKR